MHVVAMCNVPHQQAVSFSGVVQDANLHMLQGFTGVATCSSSVLHCKVCNLGHMGQGQFAYQAQARAAKGSWGGGNGTGNDIWVAHAQVG